MNEYLITLGFAILPGFSNVIGGGLAEVLPISKRTLGLALHVAVGVLLAITTIELIPRIIQTESGWTSLVALLIGGAFFILANHLFIHWQKQVDRHSHNQIAWIIFFSDSTHLLGDGLMLGASVTIDQHLGLVLAIARVISHIPLGFVTLAEFKRHQASRRFRLLILASLILPMLLGATLGYWALRGQSIIAKLAALAFTTGLLITAIVEEIIPEAHQSQDTPLSNLVFITSYAVFALFLIHFH